MKPDDSKANAYKRVAIFISFSGSGGVERMMANLAQAFLDTGFAVDMVLVKSRGQHVGAIPAAARVIDLGARHTLTSLPGLVRYLRRERPPVLLAVKDRAIKVAVLARALARVRARLVGRLGTTVSAALAGHGWLKIRLWYQGMRLFFSRVDAIVAVSEGVAEDVSRITGLPRARIHVIPNPVVSPRLFALAREPCAHPWLMDKTAAVIVAAGRLTRQKDFPTLLRAFARVRAKRPCRLIILGEGGDRPKLEMLARDLGIETDVSLPGFVDNPFSYMRSCDLFVLSSAWEGSPNVLTEALALGVPVVATDCPSGPRELLASGRYGRLVAVGDAAALAQAMLQTLETPPPASLLRQATQPYMVEQSSRRYLEVLGLAGSVDNDVRREPAGMDVRA